MAREKPVTGRPSHADGAAAASAIDFDRLYEYRFRNVAQSRRQQVWDEIAPFVWRRMGRPDRVLDPAAGRGEFVDAIPANEAWVVDAVEHPVEFRRPDIKTIIGDVMQVELPASHFDGIFVSNFLEHLGSQEEVARFLRRMLHVAEPGGVIAVLGPNFRYCSKRYFDFADHVVALSHMSVEEHLHAAGWDILEVRPRFLPYSFSGVLPASSWLTRTYLRTPLAWRVLGKQFLVLAQRPAVA